MLGIVYAINKSAGYGWTSPITLGVLAAGAAMLGLFVIVEQRVTAPLIPLSMFRLKTLTTANIVAGLVTGSFFGTGFQSTLFLQHVLGYSPLRTGAAGVITAVSAIIVASAIAARVAGRLGAARTLVIGQGIAIAGLLYLSRASVHAGYWSDLFPAFLASGIGIGLSGVAVQVSIGAALAAGLLLRRAERAAAAARPPESTPEPALSAA